MSDTENMHGAACALQGHVFGMLLYKALKYIYEKTRRDIERWREFRKKRKNKTGR